MELPLEVTDLAKEYAGISALKGLSLVIQPGEIFGLLGPNGAGKTTLISMLTTLVEPTSGAARIFGKDILTESRATKRLVGTVPQEIVSHGFFTTERVLQFHSGFYGIADNRDRIEYLMDRLALTPHRDKLVSQLSGGMKRRLLIAKSLVHSPPLLLLDEPTAGVDVELRNTLWKFVRELNREEKVSILLTTHYLREAEELCQRIGVLNNGELIELRKTDELIRKMTDREVVFTMKPGGEAIKARFKHGRPLGEVIAELNISLDQVADIAITDGTLEDAFVALLESDDK